MRMTFLIVAMAAFGCGSKGSNGGGVDMSMASDMTAPLANCMGMAQCVYVCLGGGSDINTCATNCKATSKAASSQLWVNAVLCGQNYCLGAGDMSAVKCVEVTVAGGSLLCDPGVPAATCNSSTYMSTSCLPCLNQARNIWLYDISVSATNPGPPTGMCSMPTSPDCIGAKAECMGAFAACLSDP